MAPRLRARVRRTEQPAAERDVTWPGACESSDSEDSVSLFGDLNAFFTDHRHCGDLDAGVDGEMVRITYDCGARMARRVGAADDPH